MCVPIFLQGKYRLAAGSTLWLFHDATTATNQERTTFKIDAEEMLRLFRRYYLEAGVSPDWVRQALGKLAGVRNYFQSALGLVIAKSGIIADLIDDVSERSEVEGQTSKPGAAG